MLDGNRYACFSQPKHNLGKEDDIPPERKWLSALAGRFHSKQLAEKPRKLRTEDMKAIKFLIDGYGAVPISVSIPSVIKALVYSLTCRFGRKATFHRAYGL